ncbi:unnamed protein product, partial [Prorocentrum cordatum]
RGGHAARTGRGGQVHGALREGAGAGRSCAGGRRPSRLRGAGPVDLRGQRGAGAPLPGRQRPGRGPLGGAGGGALRREPRAQGDHGAAGGGRRDGRRGAAAPGRPPGHRRGLLHTASARRRRRGAGGRRRRTAGRVRRGVGAGPPRAPGAR